jgi:hypothetical protein
VQIFHPEELSLAVHVTAHLTDRHINANGARIVVLEVLERGIRAAQAPTHLQGLPFTHQAAPLIDLVRMARRQDRRRTHRLAPRLRVPRRLRRDARIEREPREGEVAPTGVRVVRGLHLFVEREQELQRAGLVVGGRRDGQREDGADVVRGHARRVHAAVRRVRLLPAHGDDLVGCDEAVGEVHRAWAVLAHGAFVEASGVLVVGERYARCSGACNEQGECGE